MKSRRQTQVHEQAEEERAKILYRDILGQQDIHLHPMPAEFVARELARFATALWKVPKMAGYFDRQHLVNMREHLHEAQHGFTTLQHGGILEVLIIPTLPDQVMGFHLYAVFDPRDDADKGRFIGYAVYSLEKGQAPFGQAEAVRMAFDIFPEFREGHYRKVPFTNHEIYNVSRKVLFHFRPRTFLVDVKTQIRQARTGDPFKRVVYYLKRGYYPPDQKPLADTCLVRLAQGKPVGAKPVKDLVTKSTASFWVYPVASYVKRVARPKPPT